MTAKTTINSDEINSFGAAASQWWDQAKGPAKILHQINPLRLRYIKDYIDIILMRQHKKSDHYKNIKILDVGCGGGILTLPLANIGFDTTGIDASSELIEVAQHHSITNALRDDLRLRYLNSSIEDLASKVVEPKYDVITALEIIEHVADLQLFIKSCDSLLKPGGIMFLSTINRTAKAFIQAILFAEYILRWVPRGTHRWSQFVKPSEIMLHLAGYKIINISSLKYSIMKQEWKLDSDEVDINYIMCLCKAHK